MSGYHVPDCGVRLLPPQYLTRLLGGTWGKSRDKDGVNIKLASGSTFFAPYAPCSGLLLLAMSTCSKSPGVFAGPRGLHVAFIAPTTTLDSVRDEHDILHTVKILVCNLELFVQVR